MHDLVVTPKRKRSHHSRCARALIVALAAVLATAALPIGAEADPPVLVPRLCSPSGSAAGQCELPQGIAVNRSTGDIYLADQVNRRVDVFDAWGGFLRTFGGGVVSGGAAGTGDLSAGSTTVTSVQTSEKAFEKGQTISATGVPPGTKIVALGPGTITLSNPASASGTAVAISAAEGTGNVPVNERQAIAVSATGGSFNLGFSTPNPSPSSQTTTANLPFDASAAEVQSALAALSNIGPGNVEVTGPVGGPFTVEFKGNRFADTNVAELGVVPGTPPLSGGTATVSTVTEGAGAYEICDVAADCRGGIVGSGLGQFFRLQGVAIDSTGDVYVFDWGNQRVQKFDSEGHLILMFGGEVNKTTGANICTAASGDVCGPGVQGSASGFFTELPSTGSYLAVGPSNKVYVGDKERIQVFNSTGTFLESIPVPNEEVQALAVDNFPGSPSYGDIYVAYLVNNEVGDKQGVMQLSPMGSLLKTLPATNPRAIATDPSNGDVYVANKEAGKPIPNSDVEFLRFSSGGKLIEEFGKGDLAESTGIAASSPPACGLTGSDLIASNSETQSSFARIYGSPPDPSICPAPLAAPSIDAQFATSVDSTSAMLRAEINPHFWTESTRYYLEYGTGKCSEGGCTQQPTAPGALLNGPVTNEDLTTTGIFLTGLAPDTTYHYRFLAKSDGGGPITGAEGTFHTFPALVEPLPDSCPNAALRAGPSSRLPDCRAYEMVSPVEKNGSDVGTGEASFAQADEAGRRMTYSDKSAFGEPEGAFLSSQYMADRTEAGWQSETINPPRNAISLYTLGGSPFQYKAFSPGLCSGWFVQDTTEALVEGAPSETPNLYRRALCGGGYELLTTSIPPTFKLEPVKSYYYPEPQGPSADGARTVFRADDALTPNAAPEVKGKETFQVYENQPDGSLALVSVLPSETKAKGKASPLQTSVGTASNVGGLTFVSLDDIVGAVSGDAERVFWTAAPISGAVSNAARGAGPGAIYLRDNASAEESAHAGSGKCTEGDKACTYDVSKLVSGEPAQFWQGNGEGTRAIFSAAGKLYEFEAEEEGGLLSTNATLIAEGFQGFMGASSDVKRVYFVSTKALTGTATAGQNNLYFYEMGSGFKLVGALSALDLSGAFGGNNGHPSPAALLPYKRSSRVSPDGLHAAFLSTASLTGFDSTDQNNSKADAEVFLYDANGEGGAGRLACASCNSTGVRPKGGDINPRGEGRFWAAANIPGWASESQPSRALSNDGKRLFFESFEALVPRDTNGKTDVYEWEASSGEEECLEEQGGELFLEESSGCLSLISSGQSAENSSFFDATPDGKDVFFATLSSLVGKDTGLMDVYDARVDGGFAEPPPPPASCEGEACQSPPQAPNDPTPASASFEGAGNVKEPPRGSKHRKKAKHKKHAKHHKARRGGAAKHRTGAR